MSDSRASTRSITNVSFIIRETGARRVDAAEKRLVIAGQP
jgi:hypothetical protein